MVVVIKEEDAVKVVRALGIKRRIREIENEIALLMSEKKKLEQEYANLGVSVE